MGLFRLGASKALFGGFPFQVEAPAPLAPRIGLTRYFHRCSPLRRICFSWRAMVCRPDVVVHRDRIDPLGKPRGRLRLSQLVPVRPISDGISKRDMHFLRKTRTPLCSVTDLGIHGLGLVIVAIGKKLVVVLVGIVETVPASSTR
ncbi:hypothetical protein Tco_1498918 [Tanacetum coccineum]